MTDGRPAKSQPVLQSLMIPDNPLLWPDPTPEMVASPEFNAVWACIKDWDISVPRAYGGYCGATGNHVRAILDALRSQGPKVGDCFVCGAGDGHNPSCQLADNRN